MATNDEIRAKDILPHKTAFSEGDGFYGDSDTSFFMEANKLLELTAQNALAGNVAPEFVQNSTTTIAGYLYVYAGTLYMAKEAYQGVWDASKFTAISIDETFAKKLSNVLQLDLGGKICWASLTITDNGWTGPDSWLGHRIVINPDTPVKLMKGDIVYIDPAVFGGNPVRFYYGIRTNGTYTHKGWTYDNYLVASNDCEVVFTIELTNDIDAAFVDQVSRGIYVSASSFEKQASAIATFVDFENITFREGTFDYYSHRPNYSSNANRFSSSEYQYVWLNAGEKVVCKNCEKFWLSYYGIYKRFNLEQISVQEVTGGEFTITDSGYYFILCHRRSGFTTEDVLSNGGLSLVTNEGYVKVPSKFINVPYLTAPVPLGKDVLKMGVHLQFNGSVPYAVATGDALRFSTLPCKALKVNEGDVLYVNLSSSYVVGVYLQLQCDDGSIVSRSWSVLDYKVPKSGKLLLTVEFKAATDVSLYEGIMLNAFKLSQRAVATTCNKSSVEEKIAHFGVGKYYYTKQGVAHRGLESVAPENTLPAYRAAASAGFKWAETDVRFTSDGIPVCCHDRSIARTSDGTGNIDEMTLAQLRQYDFGSWKGAEFVGTPIPTFENVLNCCFNLGLNLVIDYSAGGTPNHDNLVKVVNLIKKTGMGGRVLFITTKPLNVLGVIANEAEDTYIGGVSYLSASSIPDIIANGGDFSTKAIEEYRKMGYPVSLSVDVSELTSDFLAYCGANDIPVNVYTIGNTSTLDTIADASMIQFVTVSFNVDVEDYFMQKELEKACTEL